MSTWLVNYLIKHKAIKYKQRRWFITYVVIDQVGCKNNTIFMKTYDVYGKEDKMIIRLQIVLRVVLTLF